jgi:hypothetical protein
MAISQVWGVGRACLILIWFGCLQNEIRLRILASLMMVSNGLSYFDRVCIAATLDYNKEGEEGNEWGIFN